MGALAGAAMGGGGGASLQASSSASSGPQSGTTGSLILNFGGINLGNQSIPLTQSDNQATNQPATVGRTPLAALTGQAAPTSSGMLPILLVGLAAVALFFLKKR